MFPLARVGQHDNGTICASTMPSDVTMRATMTTAGGTGLSQLSSFRIIVRARRRRDRLQPLAVLRACTSKEIFVIVEEPRHNA
jgi:hypothetical protein